MVGCSDVFKEPNRSTRKRRGCPPSVTRREVEKKKTRGKINRKRISWERDAASGSECRVKRLGDRDRIEEGGRKLAMKVGEDYLKNPTWTSGDSKEGDYM